MWQFVFVFDSNTCIQLDNVKINSVNNNQLQLGSNPQLESLPSFFSASSNFVKNSTMDPGMAASTTFLGSIPLMSGCIKLTSLHLLGSLKTVRKIQLLKDMRLRRDFRKTTYTVATPNSLLILLSEELVIESFV